MFTEELLIHYITVVKQKKLYTVISARRVLRLHGLRHCLANTKTGYTSLLAFTFSMRRESGWLCKHQTTSLGRLANLFSHKGHAFCVLWII